MEILLNSRESDKGTVRRSSICRRERGKKTILHDERESALIKRRSVQ